MPPLPSDYIHDRVSSNLQCSRHGHSFFIQGRNLRSTSQEVHTTQTPTANLLVTPTANLLVGGPPAFCILLSLSCCSRHPTPHFLWFQRNARTERRLQGSRTGIIPHSPWYKPLRRTSPWYDLNCTGGVAESASPLTPQGPFQSVRGLRSRVCVDARIICL